MSDFIKWALLAVLIVTIIAFVISSEAMQAFDVNNLGSSINALVVEVGGVIGNVRALINNFLTPAGIAALSILIPWLFLKRFILFGINLTVSLMRFIYK